MHRAAAVEDGGGLLGQSVGQALEDVSRHQIAAAAGSASALSAAFAAALVSMVARASRGVWPESGGAIAEAESLRALLGALASRDAEAFRHARALLQRSGADREKRGAAVAPSISESSTQERSDQLADALADAAAVPLAIAEAAADVAALAARTAEAGAADQRADAVVAAVLAEAAACGCAHLVGINTGVHDGDDVSVRAIAAANAARLSRDRALQQIA